MPRSRAARTLGAILILVAIGYAALAFFVGIDRPASERLFGELRRSDRPQLQIYIEILGVDPIEQSLKVRVTATPNGAIRGRTATAPDRDLILEFDDGDQAREIAIRAQEAMTPLTLDSDLADGTIQNFPLDRYHAKFRSAARAADGAGLPQQVTLWDGLQGWTVRVEQALATADGAVEFRLAARRSNGRRFLAIALYAEMALIGVAALTIGSLVFLHVRHPETGLLSALTGMVFALPALRYSMPGGPPLGVIADFLVFFWAETAVALSLALFVFTWARASFRA